MDSLANYGSDDEYEDASPASEKTRGGQADNSSSPERDHYESTTPEPKLIDPDVNYEEVQMDLSEESSSNNSPKCADDIPKKSSKDNNRDYNRDHQQHQSSSSSSTKSRRSRSRDRDSDRDYNSSSKKSSRDDRDKSSRKSSSFKDYESKSSKRRRDDSPRRDNKNRDKYRDDGNGGSSSSSSRDKNGRRRSRSRDRRRSSSRDRDSRRARSRSRSRSRDRRRRSPERKYNKRFERATNKIAQLEKLGIEIKTPDCQFLTPKELQKSMEDQKSAQQQMLQQQHHYYQQKQPEEQQDPQSNKFGIIPGISGRFSEQIRKRKLLWQKKPASGESTEGPIGGGEIKAMSGASAAPININKEGELTLHQKMQRISNPALGVWENTTFAQDSDGKVASKFKRLMGIKNANEGASSNSDMIKKQEEMFHSMEQQYEIARTATHTMRGVGLGFGSFQR